MTKGNYEFAGIPVEINSIYDYIHKMCSKYITSKEPKYIITMTEEDIMNEVKLEEESQKFPMPYLEILAVYRKFLTYAYKDNVFLFHSSSFMIDGNGFIVTAPSGTGKSTHARYLKEYLKDRFTIINDDKPLIRFDGLDYYVYGSPWNGKHSLDNNIYAPLKGIIIIYQANENKIEKLSPSIAFNHIYKQIYKPFGKEGTSAILKLSIDLTSSVDCYLMGCTNSIDAAKVSSEVIEKINNR